MKRGTIMIMRKETEVLEIGDVIITVSQIRGKQVRFHVNAPVDMKIFRKNNTNGKEPV